MFIVQHNLPFLLIEHLVNLIKAVASDSTIVKDLKIGKGKAQYTTIDIIMKEGLEGLEWERYYKKINFLL